MPSVLAIAGSDAAVIISALLVLLGGVIALGVPIWLKLRENTTTTVEARDAAVTAAEQVQRNSGSSFHDKVLKRLDEQADALYRLDERMVTLDRRTTRIEERQAGVSR